VIDCIICWSLEAASKLDLPRDAIEVELDVGDSRQRIRVMACDP
jgi:hypothetical protein